MKKQVLKVVEQVVGVIRAEAARFTVEAKEVEYKEGADIVTSADTKAQALYLRELSNLFSDAVFIGEEENLIPHNIDTVDYYITIDPLDGTKAFARGQSHGVGSMLAVVRDDEVIAAFVADVNTGEVYYYTPETNGVIRKRFGVEAILETPKAGLVKTYAVATDPLHQYPDEVAKALSTVDGGLVKGTDIMGGSIGLLAARLLKGEVSILALTPCTATPWDWNPVIGLVQKMEFAILIRDKSRAIWYPHEQIPVKEFTELDSHILIVHENNKRELLNFLNR